MNMRKLFELLTNGENNLYNIQRYKAVSPFVEILLIVVARSKCRAVLIGIQFNFKNKFEYKRKIIIKIL